MNPATYGGTEADRATDFAFNQETRGMSLIGRKTLDSEKLRQEVVYGLNLDVTETERPRNRCDTEIEAGTTTCNIAPFPFAATEDFPNRTFPDTRTTRTGLFAQDELVLGTEARVTLIPGIRYDDYEMDPKSAQSLEITTFGFEVTPVSEDNVSTNLGLLYAIGDGLTFAAQYSEGFRPPNFDESNQAFVNRAFGYATVPNPDLRPETSEGIELGLRFHTDRARFSISVYENDYRDFIASEFIGTADGISLFQDANVDLAKISGVELGGNWRVSNRFSINGALAQARGTDERTGAPLDSIDPLTGVFGLSFSNPSGRWGIDTILTFVDEKERVSAPDRVTAEPYQVVDLIGRFRAGERTVLRAGIYNVFDETYARWANIQGLATTETEAITRAQAPGTNVRFALAVEF
jgi:hemoglobin/transferrin/lactoferrin receptor protein